MSKLLLQRDRGLIRGVPTVEHRVISPELLTPKQLDYYKSGGGGYKIVASGDTLPTVGAVSSSVAQSLIANQGTNPVPTSFGVSKTASTVPSTGSIQSVPSSTAPQYSPSVAARLASGALTKEQADSTLRAKAALAANPMSAQNQMALAKTSGDIYGSATAKVPKTFDAGTLGKSGTPIVGNLNSSNSVDPFVQSLQDSAAQYQAMQDKAAEQIKPLEDKQTALTARLEQTLNKLTGKGQAQIDAEASLGVPEDTARLKELNLQIANLTNDFNRRIASLPGQGRGITTNIVAGQTDRERRLAATEIGALTSVQQALQGNIALSQQTAERTVNMEFADEEQKVQNLQILLELNSANLSRADKKAAEQLQFQLQERERQIADAKEERKSVLNLSAEAAKNGADTVTLTQMSKARTVEEALQIGGTFLASQTSTELDKLLSPAEAARLGVPYGTTKGQAIQGNTVPSFGRKSTGGGGGASSGSSVSLVTPEGKSVKLSSRANSVYENPALITNYTPTEKGKILDEISRSGLDMSRFAINNVSAGQRDQIAQYDDLFRQGQEAVNILTTTKLDTGPIASRFQAAKSLIGTADPNFNQYRSVVDNMSSALLKLRSGAAVTPQEFERIKGFIPSINDDEKTATQKISKFYNEMETARANYILRSTQTSQQILDSSIKQDPTNLRTKYEY